MTAGKSSGVREPGPGRAKDLTKADGDAAEVQAAVDEAEARGFLGTEVDATPNENYTVAGVTASKPTPETDPDYAREIRQQLDDDARGR